MAIFFNRFNGVSGGEQWRYAAPVTAAPLSFSFHVFPAVLGISGVYIPLWIGNDSGGVWDAFYCHYDERYDFRVAVAANNNFAGTDHLALNALQWNHIGGVYASSASRIAYANGIASPTETTDLTPSGIDSLNLSGSSVSGSIEHPLHGLIAEIGVWDVALTATEVTTLSQGVSPLMVRPQSLRFYAPLNDTRSQSLFGGNTVATTGGGTTDHPRVRAR